MMLTATFMNYLSAQCKGSTVDCGVRTVDCGLLTGDCDQPKLVCVGF